MTMLPHARERGAGHCPGGARCVAADIRLRYFLHGCCLLALMLSALSHAEYAESLYTAAADVPAEPAPVSAPAPAPDPVPIAEVMTLASFGPPPLSHHAIEVDYATPTSSRRASIHLDDVTTATGFADSRIRALALALDAELPRTSGVTIQPRLEVAHRSSQGVMPSFMDPQSEVSATGLAVRLYGSRPTRVSGVYPFVEADWWQDNRAKVININGTRIDTDLLRGLFSFNVGAHGNTVTGLKVWFKAKAGSRPSATIGARYRW
ncbi:hypothetical protein [Cupriavidus plantarum]|uniref:hypothetical protein n=1 Tax=Cupriavidus plantarum TaxID=942865 RepID=UPI001B16E4A5|nr:hypothetical protein [Cupriavidus plantarum]CAG2135708.1 hypothetical protein LMG26296_02243 [Cupriavidus plantarum]SMR84626.1 hypothetical protein SAMN05421735_3415 [Cupriavidus plantarum]